MQEYQSKWIKKGEYFHNEDLRVIKEIIPRESSVLEIGCGNGNLIGKLDVKKGVGVDISDKLIYLAKKNFPKVKFYCDNIIANKNKLLSELSLQEIMKIFKNLDKNVLKIFDVKNSMNSKRSHGGTSIANVKVMIKKYKKEIK